ncbi:MAG: 2-hydroxyhepta-2,4-diene-1,7-dioate isomerase [Pseudonocardiales bacterium]|nr:MAG: 2-hydroxyhepta-2,4-diene-1,7-dioate isomerase [Pseudonocardiales bacterium]
MRIARFAHPQGVAFGVVEGPADGSVTDSADGDLSDLTVAEIAEHPFGPIELSGRRWALPDVRLLAPILPTKIVGIGKNYADHAAEMGGPPPERPVMFLKPSTAVIGPGDAIRLPPDAQRVDHEAELAVVMGTVVRDVPRDRALATVLGYTCANDVTARDQQQADGQWTRAKGHDSFCPLGPWIETGLDPDDIEVRAKLDGELRQRSRTSLLLHDVATLISYVSHVMTLLPGDVILTGTPAGVGPMAAGSTVSVTVEGIGTLTNAVRAR